MYALSQAKLVDAQDKVENCQSTLHDIDLAYEQAQRLLTESNRIEVGVLKHHTVLYALL
jgi:hypothetical protein